MPYAYMRGDNCYGRGDYYRGDYYRGDPGFLGDLWKGAKKLVGGVVRGAVATVTGGPLAGIRAATTSLIPSFAPRPAPTVGMPGIGAVQPAFGPGDFDGLPQQPVGTMLPGGFLPGCQLKGTRPNKSGYYKQVVKGNPFSAVYIPKGSVCVKSRRLNVANPRALRKAIRRAQGFSKLARRVMTFVSAKAPKGRGKFKRAR
jgi:hypothetical protein